MFTAKQSKATPRVHEDSYKKGKRIAEASNL